MALSHIVMHVVLCSAASRLRSTDLPVHVEVIDRIKRDAVDRDFRVVREYGETSSIEFDIPWGTYRATATARIGKTSCEGTLFFSVLSGHDRTITVQLQDHPVQTYAPTIIMGSAPLSFSYVEPTVLVLAGSTKCGTPVGDPLSVDIRQTNNADGYYAEVYPDPSLARTPYVVAVRLKDAQGGYHYVRVPGDFLGISRGWPSQGQFDINDGFIGWVASQPEDTLLCPHLKEATTITQ